MKNSDQQISFSIVIPAFNEEKSIEKTLSLITNKLENLFFEIIIINDGSTDKTRKVLEREVEKYNNLKIINYQKNKGKGYAIKQGFIEAKGDFILMTDMDLSTPIETIFEWKEYLKKYDVLVGSRLLKTDKKIVHGPIYRQILRKLAFFIRKILFDIEIHDTQCGFKIFKKEIAKQIANKMTIDRYGADLEKIIIASKLTNKIKELPVDWIFEDKSKIKIFRDSFKTLREWLKIRSNLSRNFY